MVIRGNSWSLVVTRGHSWSLVVTRGEYREPAIEVQRYASNANYTLNLPHSIQGVDYYNIQRGASNGMEMLNFFDEALAVERADGSPNFGTR